MFNLEIFRKLNVKTYLVFIFVIVSTTPVIMLGLIQYKYLNKNFISSVQENNNFLTKELAGKVNYFLTLNSQLADIIATELNNKNILPEKHFFHKILTDYDDLAFIAISFRDRYYLYDRENYTVSDNLDMPGLYPGDHTSFRNKEIFLIEELPEIKTPEALIGIKKNLEEGYIITGLSLARLKKDIETIKAERQEDVIILDQFNNIILSPLNSQDLSRVKNFAAGVRSDFGSVDYISDSGIRKTASFARVEPVEWLVWMENPLSIYDQEIRRNAVLTIIASVISITLAIFISLIMANSQDKVVKNLMDSIRAIAKGNYSKKVSSELTFIPREFDTLIDEFNLMSERINQLDGFKSNLIDTVSHEFRTPLTSIKGFASTLLRTDANFDKETQRKLLKVISKQSDRLSRMVEDLLVVPKLEQNILKLNLQEIDLEHAIDNVTEFFPEDCFDIDIKEPVFIEVDSDRIEQVLLNLFENAHKYAYPKGSVIKVQAFKEGGFAHIIVSNPSEKIFEEQIEQLFNKFVRLDNTLTRTTGGTGLGLYITKSLVELMNGRIWIETENEQFSVNIGLPLAAKTERM